jgi:hypothetical protein
VKVELHIGRLVVHGAAEFDREAFEHALEAEIAARLPRGVDALHVAQRFRSVDEPAGTAETSARPGQGTADVVARRVAARLVR